MANKTLAKNIAQTATDFADIKTAIIDKGVNVPGGTPTADYDDLIRQIKGEEIDLSNLVRFDNERNVDLQGEGDLIVDSSKTVKLKDASDEIRALSATTGTFLSIVDLPVGYNLRGKTIVFATDDTPTIEIINNCRMNIQINPVGYSGYIEVAGQYITVFDEYHGSNTYIYSRPDSGWIQKTYTFPNDNDYIVAGNGLFESVVIPDYGEYSLQDAYVDSVSGGFNLSVGDTDHHTAIQSKDRPTWNNGTDSKEIVTEEMLFQHEYVTQAQYDALGEAVETNGITYFIIEPNPRIITVVVNYSAAAYKVMLSRGTPTNDRFNELAVIPGISKEVELTTYLDSDGTSKTLFDETDTTNLYIYYGVSAPTDGMTLNTNNKYIIG